jgi:hypothetical protein
MVAQGLRRSGLYHGIADSLRSIMFDDSLSHCAPISVTTVTAHMLPILRIQLFSC